MGEATERIERARRMELDDVSWQSFVTTLEDTEPNLGLRDLVRSHSLLSETKPT